MRESLENIAQETLDLAGKHVELAEVYVEKEDKIDMNIQGQRVDFAKEISSYGVGVRVIHDNRMGFAYTTDLSKLKKTAENAVFNAKYNAVDENFQLATPSQYENIKDLQDKKITNLSIEETIDFAKTMIETAAEEDCQPTSGGVSAGTYNTVITNSEGVFCEDRATLISGFISINIPDGEGVSTAHQSDASRFLDIDPKKITSKACQIARDSRGGKSIKTGDMKVVLDYDAAAALIYTLANAFNADNVQRGRSVYADKIDQQVLASSLNIYDDGTLKKGLNSSKSDGEGVPSQKTVIIEKGILKNLIYDIYTSKKSEVQSTGNGMRSSYADMPNVGFSNLIMEFEEKQEISHLKNGLLVYDLLGAHTANPISGDFSVEAMNAFKIEDGEITDPIKKAMISGNIFQAFNDAIATSKKTRQIGPLVLPPIMVSQLRVVG
jgi:PmbA protein